MEYKKIFLTRGKYTLVDDDDYRGFNSYKWYAFFDGHNYYALRWSKTIKGKRHAIRMHREIMQLDKNDIKQVDHINGNTLDNRKDNLRVCFHYQNLMNKRKTKIGKFGIKYKGVTFHQTNQKYVAQIRHMGNKISKQFNNSLDAARWFDEQARILRGEYARINGV